MPTITKQYQKAAEQMMAYSEAQLNDMTSGGAKRASKLLPALAKFDKKASTNIQQIAQSITRNPDNAAGMTRERVGHANLTRPENAFVKAMAMNAGGRKYVPEAIRIMRLALRRLKNRYDYDNPPRDPLGIKRLLPPSDYVNQNTGVLINKSGSKSFEIGDLGPHIVAYKNNIFGGGGRLLGGIMTANGVIALQSKYNEERYGLDSFVKHQRSFWYTRKTPVLVVNHDLTKDIAIVYANETT